MYQVLAPRAQDNGAFAGRGARSYLGLVRMRTTAALAIGIATLTGAPGHPAAEAEPLAAARGADCVTYEASAVYRGLGYQHQVVLTNGCERDATCMVSTDVNPQAQQAIVKKGESETVVTFQGSPARTFTANVSCQLAD